MEKTTIKTVKDLKVYNLTYTLAMEIFDITKRFSKDCRYITIEEFTSLDNRYGEVGAMLNSLINKWQNL